MSEDALLVKSAGAKSSIYLSAIANNLPPAELPIGNFNIPLAGAQKLTTRNGDTVLLSPCPRKNTRMEGLIAIANLTLWFLYAAPQQLCRLLSSCTGCYRRALVVRLPAQL